MIHYFKKEIIELDEKNIIFYTSLIRNHIIDLLDILEYSSSEKIRILDKLFDQSEILNISEIKPYLDNMIIKSEIFGVTSFPDYYETMSFNPVKDRFNFLEKTAEKDPCFPKFFYKSKKFIINLQPSKTVDELITLKEFMPPGFIISNNEIQLLKKVFNKFSRRASIELLNEEVSDYNAILKRWQSLDIIEFSKKTLFENVKKDTYFLTDESEKAKIISKIKAREDSSNFSKKVKKKATDIQFNGILN